MIARSFGYKVYSMGPHFTDHQSCSAHHPFIAAAGCIAESVIYKQALTRGFVSGGGQDDWRAIRQSYETPDGQMVDSKVQYELLTETARLVRQHLPVIKDLAALHQENDGCLDGDQLDAFFLARRYYEGCGD